MSNRKWRARPSVSLPKISDEELDSTAADFVVSGHATVEGYLAECGRVAKAFPPHRRRLDKNLPWELYVALADCSEAVQEAAMDEYEATGKMPEAMRFKQ